MLVSSALAVPWLRGVPLPTKRDGGDRVMTAGEFEKALSAARSLAGQLPAVSPVCRIEYGSPIGVTAQADREAYPSITAEPGVQRRVWGL